MRGECNTIKEQFGRYSAEEIISLEKLSSEEFWQTIIDVQKEAKEVFAEDLFPLLRGEKGSKNSARGQELRRNDGLQKNHPLP